ncbi:dihydroorotase [Portibacter lacus]|uniref:Dihydroorotase n=1 Tax=Portibacter lacus TaxID=1099794 RepID=A0AA37SME8_9BACT|nr:dihydroorotase [Portibacter lacus]GLR16615.1 dihydroorotase [Portibacter lacus]
MKLILKQAKIIDPSWNKEKKRFDIAIKNGKIEKIASNIDLPSYKIISSENLHVSIGFFDIGTQIGEPGLEHREDFASITEAASAGGYTGIAPFPNNEPATQSKSEVKYIINNTSSGPISFYPIGAVSKSCKGEDITEFIDMKKHGAVAFSDGKKSVHDAGLMLRSLQYAKASDSLIINHPDEHDLSGAGQIHEGIISVSLGLEGIPEMAESLGLQRDIQLAQYAQSRYCAYNVSSAHSVKILKKTKWATSTVSYLNLLFTDTDLEDFNSNLKVIPPLRSRKDKNALIKALKTDVINCITSGHRPLEEELKKKSFAFADFGAIGIETTFAALLTELEESLGLEKIIEKLTHGPRNVLGVEIPQIKEGERANICIFDPKTTWIYDKVKSKSKNSPFIGSSFKGKVLGIINNGKYISQ